MTSPSEREKKKRKTTDRHKWIPEEEISILEFIKTSSQSGKQYEKPSAPEFYRQFLRTTDCCATLKTLPVDKIVQHMKSLRTTYASAIEWRNKTGQGILDENEESGAQTVKDELLRRCKYFEQLDELFGTKPQYNPPFTLSSVIPISDFDEEIGNNGIQIATDQSMNEYFSAEDIVEDINNRDEVTPIATKSVVSKLIKKRKSPIKNAASALESAMKSRVAVEEKRLDWEMRLKTNELQRLEDQRNAENVQRQEQAKFENNKWEQEFELRKRNDDRDFELKKLKLDKDAELEKLRIEKEFELEKLRLNMSID